ncbi:hypothetical protein [Mycobacterium sp. E1747]|uniref:hypothetical protein n=1 Tax=Mycobacterium sp. E1747 TaxID=1834128 RepID=UPI0007FB869C|nr:hypothetical protein [Mycobacterium sp. E1747]OBH10060.1 hypothetical protein A5695_22690 [Mycobacterium sp. E1747]
MAGNEGEDNSLGGVAKGMAKHWLRNYGSVYLAFALPTVITYVIAGGFLAWIIARVYPQAFAIVATILVAILVAALVGIFYLRRKLQHFLTARRADRQNTAYLRGKEHGVYGKFRPENLD